MEDGLPLEVSKTVTIGRRVGWTEIETHLKDDKYYVTGVSPETGKRDLLPVVEELQRLATVQFLENRLCRLEDEELHEEVSSFAQSEFYQGMQDLRDFIEQDAKEAEVVRECLAGLRDGSLSWKDAHLRWKAAFERIHEEVLAMMWGDRVDGKKEGGHDRGETA